MPAINLHNALLQLQLAFCLVTVPTAAPEFVKLSSVTSSGFANRGIDLKNAGEICQLTVPLPAYFGSKPFALEFVPDRDLAEQIFGNVSRALRAVSKPGFAKNGILVEGTSKLRREQPVFSDSKVRWADGELPFARAD